MLSSPYRPHNPGHNYHEAGTYLITLVVTGREPRLSRLNDDAQQPAVELLPKGAIVAEEWEKTAAIQQKKGRKVRTLAQVCMPDHWHGVVAIDERMDVSLGYIIQCFKSSCTARWRREITGFIEPTNIKVEPTAALRARTHQSEPNLAREFSHTSHHQRQAYYASRPLIERPLFDDDYDDTICINAAHLQRMLMYVADNPRRAIMRRLFPQFMERRLHVRIDGVDYAAFGNLFLLRWAKKVQVFCHRRARMGQLSLEERQQYGLTFQALPEMVTRIPYESTQAFRLQHEALVTEVLAGATVAVTPGISKGEQLLKKECLSRGFPLIHLQKEPIGPYWKPEQTRFDACSRGTLLILAPWSLDDMPAVNGIAPTTDFSRYHNMNTLAAQICNLSEDSSLQILR